MRTTPLIPLKRKKSKLSSEEVVKRLQKPAAEAEEDQDAIWLLSYADLLTLLLTFFLMLYASVEKNDDPRRHLASFVGGDKTIEAQNLEKVIIALTKDDRYLYDVQTRATVEGVEITFATTVLFDSGKAEFRAEMEPSLRKLISVLKQNSPNDRIRVEGHTDDEPTRAGGFPSNWELSGARASTVIRAFESAGFAPEKLMAIGYGSSRPIYANREPAGAPIPANRARNRRVVVVVVKEAPTPPSP